MKNYVLVHGAWGGAWEFAELVERLKRDGSHVTAVDLPGHGENKAPLSEVTFEAYVSRVIDVVNSIDGKVELVGHSLAGAVVSQVTETIPDKINNVIFVAAFLLKSGESVFEIMQSDNGQLLANATFSEDQTYATLSQKVIADILLHDVKDADAVEYASKKMAIKQATHPFMAQVTLTKEKFGSASISYIRATLDKALTLNQQNAFLNNWPVKNVFTLESGHFPLTSVADELAAAIKEID